MSKGKLRFFLLSKKWDTIRKSDWINFLDNELNASEREYLEGITPAWTIYEWIESPPNRTKMDSLRRLYDLGTISEQNAENEKTIRKVKMEKYLANQNAKRREENKKNKLVNSMFGNLYVSNGNVPTFRKARKSRKTRKTRKTRKMRR